MSAKILHSKRWFLHSEWRTEISPFRTEISPFRMEIYPFRTGRLLHSEWRFPHFSILNGEKNEKKTLLRLEDFFTQNGDLSIQNGIFFILNAGTKISS